MKKLPTTVYVDWSPDVRPGEEYLRIDPDPQTLVETGETRRVGIYKLEGFAVVKNETTTTVTKSKVRR